MDIAKLKERREKLAARLKMIDARIAKIERAAREAEKREIMKMIQSRGLDLARLSELLDAATGGDNPKGGAE